ncbi:MAG: hypothetical protein AAGF71_10150 [Pseudomonadota bacterium]
MLLKVIGASVGLILATSLSLQAAPVTWELDVVENDGPKSFTVSGTFTYDSATMTILDVALQGFNSATMANETYDSAFAPRLVPPQRPMFSPATPGYLSIVFVGTGAGSDLTDRPIVGLSVYGAPLDDPSVDYPLVSGPLFGTTAPDQFSAGPGRCNDATCFSRTGTGVRVSSTDASLAAAPVPLPAPGWMLLSVVGVGLIRKIVDRGA